MFNKFKISSFEKKIFMLFPIMILVETFSFLLQNNWRIPNLNIFFSVFFLGVISALATYFVHKLGLKIFIRLFLVIWKDRLSHKILTRICYGYAGICLSYGVLMFIDAFPYSTFFLNFLLSWTLLAPLVVTMNLEEFLSNYNEGIIS